MTTSEPLRIVIVDDEPLARAIVKEYLSRQTGVALLAEEYDKLQRASNRDVHDNSKATTLPIAREIADVYVLGDRKLPWYIDLLNINLGVHTLAEAKRRIQLLVDAFRDQNARVTHNLDFEQSSLR